MTPECPEVQEALLEQITRGTPLTETQRAHLAACPDCQAERAFLQAVQLEVLDEVSQPPVAPPAHLRADLLRRAVGAPMRRARPDLRRWALGTAAAVAALALGSLLFAPPSLAHALPDPAVVVSAGGALLVASNGAAGQPLGQARVALVSGERVTASLSLPAPHPAWFTEGVRLGESVYLADAGNDRVLEIQLQPLRLLRSIPVPGGVAGLTVGAGRVYFKSVRGQVGRLPLAGERGLTVSVASEAPMPMPDVMDAALLHAGSLYVTHHARGELARLDPETLRLRAAVTLGGAPVALAERGPDLLVLDHRGRLLRVNDAGKLLQNWRLPGQPDKLVLNGDDAILTDRAGRVTRLNLGTGQWNSTALPHPMDVAVLPGGALAVAQAQTGVALLHANLSPMPGGGVRGR